MILAEFFKTYTSIFSGSLTYPDFVTSTLKNQIDADLKAEYPLRKLRKSFDKLAEIYEKDYDAYVRDVVLALLIRNTYKYETLLATEGFEYDPIENYRMVETMEDDITTIDYGKTDTLQHGQSQTRTPNTTQTRTPNTTDTRTPNTTETRTPNTTETRTPNNLTSTETDQIEGFNSGSFQDANKKTIVQTGSEGITRTGTETVKETGTETVQRTGSETIAETGSETVANSGSDIDTLSGRDTHTRNYELTRSGNIGVTTSQQMIEAERNVADFSALKVICADIALEITYGVF